MNKLENALQDGHQIKELEIILMTDILKIKSIYEFRKTHNFATDLSYEIGLFKENFTNFKNLIKKYPNFEFIKEQTNLIDNSAKKNLPEEIYKQIYED